MRNIDDVIEARHAARMSVNEFAERIGVSASSVLKWETGARNVTPAMLQHISNIAREGLAVAPVRTARVSKTSKAAAAKTEPAAKKVAVAKPAAAAKLSAGAKKSVATKEPAKNTTKAAATQPDGAGQARDKKVTAAKPGKPVTKKASGRSRNTKPAATKPTAKAKKGASKQLAGRR
jgi:transcriptional regulator with XRE-family HTH domain